MQALVDHGKQFGSYSLGSRKPLESYKQSVHVRMRGSGVG